LRIILLLLSLMMCSCTTVRPERGVSTRVYLGLVKIVVPQTRGTVTAFDVETVGFGWDESAYLGWRSGSWVMADPAECQLLIIIKNAAQAGNAAEIIRSLEGQDPCIVDHSGSLRP